MNILNIEKPIVKNFIYAFTSHAFSMLATLVVTLIVPTLIGVKQFSYWQLFLTYVSYVNLFGFGVGYGLYLRLGGKNYKDLDFKLLVTEKVYFYLIEIFISVIMCVLIDFINIESDRKFVLFMCFASIFIINAKAYFVFIFQATNRTIEYSISIIIQNIPWLVATIIIATLKIHSYKIIIAMYLIGHISAYIYLLCKSEKLKSLSILNTKQAFEDMEENIKCGSKLMISIYVSSLIITSSKLIVDFAWGIEIFGYFSFSLTLANVFLNFIKEVSIIIFPALRRINNKAIKKTYNKMNDLLDFILPSVMLGCLPITIFVNNFLPQYTFSIKYLPFFLPMCVFDGKMEMLCSPFLKAIRKENILLEINIISLMLNIALVSIGAFYIKNMEFIAISVLFVIMLRNVLSEIYLCKYLETNKYKNIYKRILLTIIFVYASYKFSETHSFIIFLIIYIIYLFIERRKNIGFLRLK